MSDAKKRDIGDCYCDLCGRYSRCASRCPRNEDEVERWNPPRNTLTGQANPDSMGS